MEAHRALLHTLAIAQPPMQARGAAHARRLGRLLGAAGLPPTPVPRAMSSVAAAAAAPSADAPPAPSLPPRAPRITDGRWDKHDDAAVRQALEDASKITRQAAKLGGGEVLLARTLEDLQALAAADGQPAYRGTQLRDGVLRGARQLDDISNLPKPWRASLAERGVSVGRSALHHEVAAADGTRKFLLRLHDGLVVEAVGIPVDDAEHKRLTVCVSSQVRECTQTHAEKTRR